MASHPSHPHGSEPPQGGPGALDPASQSLADALNRSFAVLKMIMLILIVVYAFSGVFSVKPNEAGAIVRFGRIVGTGPGEQLADAVLEPGWHLSWPYPIDRWIIVPTSERELKVDFLFQLSEQEQASGIAGYKYNALSPERDDYLITGDVNIIHASLQVKYRLTDLVAYLKNVYPAEPDAGTSGLFSDRRHPEHALLTNLVRNAVIQAAAAQEALDIRGPKQGEFLAAVGQRVNAKLSELSQRGTPLGVTVTSILAPKKATVEAIFPPRQVQEEFEKVDATQNQRGRVIAEEAAKAQEMLTQTAGADWAGLSEAIDDEFHAGLALSAAEQDSRPEAELATLRSDLEKKREVVERLLAQATGSVQVLIKSAEIYRDQIVNQAVSDRVQVLALMPEFNRNPELLMSRLRDELYSSALVDPRVVKLAVPQAAKEYWLQIPRAPSDQSDKTAGYVSPTLDAETLIKQTSELGATPLQPMMNPMMTPKIK